MHAAPGSDRRFRAQSLKVLLVVSILSLTGCETTRDMVAQKSPGLGAHSATFGKSLVIKDFICGETDFNLEELGRNFIFELTITGAKDKSVPIRIFSQDAELMGEAIAVPTDNSTKWEEFHVFVPLTKMTKIKEVGDAIKVYAVSPEDPTVYLGLTSYTWTNLSPHPVTWKLKEIESDVDLGLGAKGIKVKFDLEVENRAGQQLEILPFLNGKVPNERELNSIKFTKALTPPTYQHAVFVDLIMVVPYEALDRLASATSATDIDTITIGPAIRHNGQYEVGNIRLRLPPAGTLDRQVNAINQKLKSIDDAIEYLEKQSDILSRGIAR